MARIDDLIKRWNDLQEWEAKYRQDQNAKGEKLVGAADKQNMRKALDGLWGDLKTQVAQLNIGQPTEEIEVLEYERATKRILSANDQGHITYRKATVEELVEIETRYADLLAKNDALENQRKANEESADKLADQKIANDQTEINRIKRISESEQARVTAYQNAAGPPPPRVTETLSNAGSGLGNAFISASESVGMGGGARMVVNGVKGVGNFLSGIFGGFSSGGQKTLWGIGAAIAAAVIGPRLAGMLPGVGGFMKSGLVATALAVMGLWFGYGGGQALYTQNNPVTPSSPNSATQQVVFAGGSGNRPSVDLNAVVPTNG